MDGQIHIAARRRLHGSQHRAGQRSPPGVPPHHGQGPGLPFSSVSSSSSRPLCAAPSRPTAPSSSRDDLAVRVEPLKYPLEVHAGHIHQCLTHLRAKAAGQRNPGAPRRRVPCGLLPRQPEVLPQQTLDPRGVADLARRNGHAEDFTTRGQRHAVPVVDRAARRRQRQACRPAGPAHGPAMTRLPERPVERHDPWRAERSAARRPGVCDVAPPDSCRSPGSSSVPLRQRQGRSCRASVRHGTNGTGIPRRHSGSSSPSPPAPAGPAAPRHRHDPRPALQPLDLALQLRSLRLQDGRASNAHCPAPAAPPARGSDATPPCSET
jgi:hypothetical protein